MTESARFCPFAEGWQLLPSHQTVHDGDNQRHACITKGGNAFQDGWYIQYRLLPVLQNKGDSGQNQDEDILRLQDENPTAQG